MRIEEFPRWVGPDWIVCRMHDAVEENVRATCLPMGSCSCRLLLETAMFLSTMPPVWRLCMTVLVLGLGVRYFAWELDEVAEWNPDRLRHRTLVPSSSNVKESSFAEVAPEIDHRFLHTDVPINVTINLELYYLNETVADMLGPQDGPLNDASAHFCAAVFQQAGGSQVQSALVGTGIVIDTHFVNGSLGCSILGTTRVIDSRGEILFGDGFDLVLQLQVQQLVYITSGSILSQAEVEDIVDLGFKRAIGGRVAFRSLLRQDPAFSTISNVEVFTLAPSESPSHQPSGVPSDQPSMLPTLFPSVQPSFPEFPAPSPLPTTTIDTATLVPTTNWTDITVDNASGPNSGVIYGSVLGSLGVLLLLSICLMCTWFPICSRPNSLISASSSSTDSRAGMIDSQDSFAASPDTGYEARLRSTDRYARNRILVVESGRDVEGIGRGRANSFDEVSVYTAGTSSESAVRKPAGATQMQSNGNAAASSLASSLLARRDSAGKDVAFPDPVSEMPRTTGKERSSGLASTNSESVARRVGKEETKEFDPFQDDEHDYEASKEALIADFGRSFDSDEKSGKRISRSSSHIAEDRSQPSASSSRTPKIRNTTAHKRHTSSLLESKDAFQAEDESVFGLSPWDIELRSNDGATTTFSNVSNSSLLRSILEDAQRRSQHSSTDVPMKSVHLRRGPVDHILSHSALAFEETKTQAVVRYSCTVDVPVQKNAISRRNSLDLHQYPAQSIESIGISRSASSPDLATLSKSYRTPVQSKGKAGDPVAGDGTVKYTKDRLRDRMPAIALVHTAPVSPLSINLAGDTKLSSSETTASSPGILGIRAPKQIIFPSDDASLGSQDTGNPWLFDTIEQTLGPRSHTADMESISGRSSRSGASNKSNCSHPPNRFGSTTRISNGTSTVIEAAGPSARLEGDRQSQVPGQSSSSSLTADAGGSAIAAPVSSTLLVSRSSKVTQKELIVPPGKLGVVLVDRHDGRGAIVSDVRFHSPLFGKVQPGDRLMEVDEHDVSSNSVRQITELMASRIALTRRLRVICSISLPPDIQEETFENDSNAA